MSKAAKKETAQDTPGSRFNGLITLCGRELHLRTAPEHVVRGIAQEYQIDDNLARAMAQRGFNKESAGPHLNPELRYHLPDPLHFLDMEKAVKRTADAIQNGEQIAGFTDYDTDGATALAITKNFMRWIGVSMTKYVPDRFKEGYGPNSGAMQQLHREGAGLCLMFDCGTAAVDRIRNGKLELGPIKVAQQLGMDVLVFDHHSPEAALPPAYAVVNPMRLDETTPHKQPAACGMSLMFVIALNRELRNRGFYRERSRGIHRDPNDPTDIKPKEPYVMKAFEPATIGTVQDMMPLTGINHLIVHTGMKLLNAPPPTDTELEKLGYTREEYQKFENPGIDALRAVCGLGKNELAQQGRELTTEDLSFQIGPRLNASGRIDVSRTSVDLLTMENGNDALDFAMRIDTNNFERRQIESQIVAEAMPLADEQMEAGRKIIVVSGRDWHPGVVGIVASRIKEKYELPTIVIGAMQNDQGGYDWKGSGRSIKSGDLKVDLGGAVTGAKHAGLIDTGGGHKMAAGLGMDSIDRLDDLRDFLEQRLAPQIAQMPQIPPLYIDAVMTPGGITRTFIEQVKKLGPHGEGNPEMMILLPDVQIETAAITGDSKHVRCTFTKNGERLGGIAFRSATEAYGQAILEKGTLHLVGTANLNHFNGKATPQFKVVDVLRP